MTLPDAHETARNAAVRFGKPFRVYRLAAWPPAVYGATSLELPQAPMFSRCIRARSPAPNP